MFNVTLLCNMQCYLLGNIHLGRTRSPGIISIGNRWVFGRNLFLSCLLTFEYLTNLKTRF